MGNPIRSFRFIKFATGFVTYAIIIHLSDSTDFLTGNRRYYQTIAGLFFLSFIYPHSAGKSNGRILTRFKNRVVACQSIYSNAGWFIKIFFANH